MNYEKKYKEALERMKSWVKGEHPECFCEAQKAAEFVFPELKENEDENIRKAIKYGLDHVFTNNTTIFEVTKEQCLSWLEGQDDQKPVLNEEDEKMFKSIIECIDGTGLLDSDQITWFKSLKDRVGCKVNYMTTKEWSEEDEYQINTILHGLDLKRAIYRKEKNKVEEDRYNTQYNWLKSFKDRVGCEVNCTTTKEWSEDDEYQINTILHILNLKKEIYKKRENKVEEDRYNTQYNWLKSIKDKYKDAVEYDKARLEKQDEQKETLCDKCRREQPYHSCQDITELGRCVLEHQCEQKSNNVESKFKVGDWIIQNGVGTYKIVEVCESWYEVVDAEDNQYSISFDKEYMCHLWTIQDAKDGDVLTFVKNGTIFIFKNVLDNMPYSYCGIDYFARFRNCIEEGGKEGRNWTSSLQGICPATKKQRDILFQKMKEAEYEWDAENKLIRRLSKFHVGDKLISSKNPRLTYNILEVGHINELGNTEYKVEIFTDGKAQNPCNILYMECCKVDEWAELINQKSNDKVEPKFKAGDLAVDNCGYIWKIEGILNQFYLLEGVEGGESRPPIELVNKNFHLWTIQDAKDGDVLSYVTDKGNLWILIYKSFYEPYEGHVHYHALLANDDFSCEGTCCISIDNLKPSSIEQRKLLFQKIEEVGYKWDLEKKELINE